MKDRIQINGIWYIREDQVQESIELDLTEFEGVVVENDCFCFEATRIRKNSGGYHSNIDMKFTDKRVKPWKEDNWDSNDWMRGVLRNDPESLENLPIKDPKDIKYFQAFLQHLEDEEWL
jgi:hypothetical protein